MYRGIWHIFQTSSGEAERTGTVGQEIIQGLFYLKKCIMALGEARQLPPLLPLCQRLVNAGISCQVMLSEELLFEELLPVKLPPDKKGAGETACGAEKLPEPVLREAPEMDASPGMDFSSEMDFSPGILYLTDDPLVYGMLADAFPFGAGGCPPVLIYLHPGNEGADFGDAPYALEEPEETEPEYLERVYRRCHDLPWEILTTERCWLRETVEADVDSFWQMYQDAGITRYTQQLYPTPEAERKYVREYRRLVYAFYEFGVWTVLDRKSGAVVGRAGLSVREGYDLPELGFVIHRDWQGRGLAGEVCRGILRYARESLGFERIQVLVHEENTVSLHLCQKLGFQQQAVPQPAGKSREQRTDKSGTACPCHQEEEEQGEGFGRKVSERTKAACPSCLVEMEQNGQMARFVYMVCDSKTRLPG